MNGDEIASYLKTHPEFFDDHADLLATIEVRHPHEDRAIPLTERQLVQLRERNRVLEGKLRELVDFGEENDSISERLHRATVALLRAHDVQELMRLLYFHLREDFVVPSVAVRLWEGPQTEMAESSPVGTANMPRTTDFTGSIGYPIPSTEISIRDDDGNALPIGSVGEICIRGPQVMRGYWNKPGETANVLRDGWLYTGDLAIMDTDGFFKIVGRKKEMIDASGYKVYPDEVDRVLMSHPAVLEAATIGVPDTKRGETVKSFVVLRPGMSATAEVLTAHARESLAPYKVPKEIEFRAELPKSAALKILRRELHDEEVRKRKITV